MINNIKLAFDFLIDWELFFLIGLISRRLVNSASISPNKPQIDENEPTNNLTIQTIFDRFLRHIKI